MGKYISEHLSAGGTYIEVVYPEKTSLAFLGSVAPRRAHSYTHKVQITKYPNDIRYGVEMHYWVPLFGSYIKIKWTNRKNIQRARRRAEKWLDKVIRDFDGQVKRTS